jgi:signal transduction histidine kinase
VSVRLLRRPAEVVLEVEDDGAGIEQGRLRQAPFEGHIGLASATERVEALDGELEISTHPLVGTLMRVRIPAPPEDESPPGEGPPAVSDPAVAPRASA